MLPHSLIALFLPYLLLPLAQASVTVYTTYTSNNPQPTSTVCYGANACDQNVAPLVPIPDPASGGLSQSVPVQLFSGGMNGLSRPVKADFMGFSIELSVINQITGNHGNNTKPIFLNLMGTLASRGGRVLVRVGGNSQEAASVQDNLPNGTAIYKTEKNTYTPKLLIGPNLIEVMGNISKLVNIDWFIGLPFNDTVNYRPELAVLSQQILGDHLIGMQLGNEPDLYHNNQLRAQNYAPQDFTTEFGTVLNDYQQLNIPKKNIFVAPSVCCGQDIGWTPEMVWQTGFLDQYAQYLSYVSVEHYPSNNCFISKTPLEYIQTYYANHSAVINLSTPYLNSVNLAAGKNLPFIMFETNTASCGGFPGISDSFGSALWSVDYNMGMASSNFSNALYHVGGQSDYYNAFTPPPTNISKTHQWTIGPTMYTALVTAEALGQTGNSQVVDLLLNNNNPYSPGYAIYENGNPTKLVFINYLSDNGTGAANYTAFVSVGGNQTGQAAATPSSVKVKYLLSPNASEKWNITWGGQTFGGAFQSDGRLKGEEFVYDIACDTTNNVCPITVPAPGVALVFLSDQSRAESTPTATLTYSTSVLPTSRNTVTIDPSVLATSNGRGGQHFIGLGSTSFETERSSAVQVRASIAMVAIAVISAFMIGYRRL